MQTSVWPWHGCNTYHALPAQEIWNYLFIDVIQQASRALVVISRINEEFPSCVVVNKWTNLKPIRQNSDVICCRGSGDQACTTTARTGEGRVGRGSQALCDIPGKALGPSGNPACFPL